MKSLTASGRCVFYITKRINKNATYNRTEEKKDLPWSFAAAAGKPPAAWPIETHHS